MPSRYHLWVSGCQMNASDARWLADALDGAGMAPADRFDDADVAILYTCSVRQSAEDRVHGQLGHLKSLKARRPDMVLCVTGCMAGADTADLRRRYPFVDLFVAPTELEKLPDLILSAADETEACAPASTDYADRVPVSAGVTVIRGCDKYCSYCVVPFRRGPQRSRPAEEILAEAGSLLSRGSREIVLLGQTVDAWGRDLTPEASLAGLLRQVASLPGLARLRFLTSHPNDFTPDLIEAMAETPQVCEELNLPIQAGDDDVLRRMARRYTVRQYLDLLAEIRARIPDIALSTDVIVGFPGETERQFANTMRVLREVEFDVVHVAAYSPRPGTAAARKMADDVPPEEKKRRLHEVEVLQTEIASRKNGGMVGRQVEVLVERREKGKWSGRTRSNKLVFFESERDLKGELVTVAVDGAGAWSLRGQLV
ncbi:MAG: tRNA (N6-isopentenyl adenosine(37)-C2)-methylthiotransferase MiaB [Sphingomonadaceae bacterium]